MEGPDETTPLITAGEAPGAIPGRMGGHEVTSAPALIASDVVISPGSQNYVTQARRYRQHQLRLARGTGRRIELATAAPPPGPRSESSENGSEKPIVVRARGKNTRGNDADDPLSGVRVAQPYEHLQGQNPDAHITRAPIAHEHDASDTYHRTRYYNSLRNVMFNHMQRLVDEDESDNPIASTSRNDPEATSEQEDALSRYGEDLYSSFLVRPDHTIPPTLFHLHVPSTKEESDEPGSQSSIVTILSLWNTMMGTSLLAMPWACAQAGLVAAPIIAIVMGAIANSTAVLIVKLHKWQGEKLGVNFPEFPQLAGSLMNRVPGFEIAMGVSSLVAVAGALTVYWMLITNFMYNTGNFLYSLGTGTFVASNHTLVCAIPPSNGGNDSAVPVPMNETLSWTDDFGMDDFLGPGGTSANFSGLHDEDDFFHKIWRPHSVAVMITSFLFPLICVRSLSFFAKFNSFGTVNVIFLISLIVYFAFTWGFHVDISDPSLPDYTPLLKETTFFSLSGTLALGLFIHNAIITIVKNNKYPENNARDTTIGFVLVLGTYIFVGMTFYVTFPLAKSCIADNILNNFHPNDPLIIATRFSMLAQLTCIFPLVMYILRSQTLAILAFKSERDLNSRGVHIAVNAVFVSTFIIITIVLPSISTVIRYAGSGCGLIMIFVAPIACHYVYMKRNNQLNYVVTFIEVLVVILGAANFASQFFMHV